MNAGARNYLFLVTLLAACAFGVSPLAQAAPLEHDLGEGLRLYRLHELPADLPPTADASGRLPPCVADVRYTRADHDGATAFAAWLRFRAKPRVPVFVLANAGTSSALLEVLAARDRGAGIVLVGVPGRQLEPDVAVRTNSEDERRAYDALEQGVPLATLLTDNPHKVRNDEASFSRDRLAEASAEEAADELAAKNAVPPVDAALQRAVHLHRALLALKKI